MDNGKDKAVQELREIRRLLQTGLLPVNDRLWSLNEVADYLQVATFTARQKVVCRPDFPAPIRATDSFRRWVAGEVIDWAKRNRAGRGPGK